MSPNHAITQYIEPVFRFCLERLASKQDAEDLSQEILVHAIHGLGRYEIRSLDAWIWRIAHNRYARFVDDRASRVKMEISAALHIVDDSDPFEGAVIKAEHQDVFAALHTLAATYREIMVDFYVHELSVAAISQKHHIPETTVKWRLHVGRQHIKERMDNMGKVYSRINWQTSTCNGNMDANRYLSSQIARAICSVTYDKPMTVEEISLTTGLPTMYIEDEIPRLVYGDALIEENSKYVANFIMLKLEDNRRLLEMLSPHVTKMADLMHASLDQNADDVKQLGFYGCEAEPAKIGHLIVPLVMRQTIKHIQERDSKLSYGPFPPRKDGGYGWFIVHETEDESEGLDFSASGLNTFSDRKKPEKGCLSYFWVGRYFSLELYRQGMQWMFQHDLVAKAAAGRIPEGLIDAADLARLTSLNLVQKASSGYLLTTPVFTRIQWERLAELYSSLVERLQDELSALVHEIWNEFRKIVPAHLYDQVNQYLASYVHHLVGLTIITMVKRGQLIAPPEKGPLSYGVFCTLS